MPQIIRALILGAALLNVSLASAQVLKAIELDWEEVPDAASYVIKLTNAAGGAPLYFTTKEAHLSEQVPVGTYELRIRSRAKDEDIYSPWSDAVALEVVVKELKPLSPIDKTTLEAKGSRQKAVDFEWTPVEKVKEYSLEIWTEDPNFKPLFFKTKVTKKNLTVKTGHQYFWRVSFETSNDTTYLQTPATFSFTLIGEKLLPPTDIKVARAGDDQVLTWKAADSAKSYRLKLYFRFLDESDFRFQREAKVISAPWSAGPLRAGAYKVEVVAMATNRTDSEARSFEFVVKPTESQLNLR